MTVTHPPAETIVNLLRERKIATMAEFVAALGTTERTVFRKLKKLSYHASYSHNGRYYTLSEVAAFDALGLWSYNSVGFSLRGTLLATVEAIVSASERGHFIDELDSALHVATKDVLRKLSTDGRLIRERIGRHYLYCSADTSVKQRQVQSRKEDLREASLGGPFIETDDMQDETKAAIILFFSLLDEKLRRLYAGLESLKIGHGGDRRVADLLGLDPATVARGRSQLVSRDIEVDRTRRSGGGRPAVEKKRRK
jgi:hypothetical protein